LHVPAESVDLAQKMRVMPGRKMMPEAEEEKSGSPKPATCMSAKISDADL
jgi:hypothetical protein